MVRRSSTENFERIAHLRERVHAAPGRPARPDLAGGAAPRGAARRALQPRGAVVRAHLAGSQPSLTGEFTALGVTRAARRDAPCRPRDPLLPGVELRDVRQGARDAAERADAVLSAQPVRRREGLRPPHHGELPRELRAVRGLGNPVQPRVAAPRARVRDAQDHARRSRASSSGSRTSCALGNLDAKRDWGYAPEYVDAMWRMLQPPKPCDFVIGTGVAHSLRDCRDSRSRTSSSTPRLRALRSRAAPARRGRHPARRSAQGARESSAGRARTRFGELIELMVDADLEPQERATGRAARSRRAR